MTTYQPNVHLFGCVSLICEGCVAVAEPVRPAQRPASTSEARKRKAERVAAHRAALVAAGAALGSTVFELDEREES